MIVSLLGEGGMGKVYVARDTRLQRSIALKIMQPEAPGSVSGSGASNGAARLLREAQAAAGLEHPNVVTIYEVGEIGGAGEDAGLPFIAMELVKGRPLRALIGAPQFSMKERIRWLTDVARALGAAHRSGLIHRDMKPENVMLRDDGVVKVLDFGLAKRATSGEATLSSSTEAQVLPSLTGKGVAIGTPYYMAPEQMRRETLDGRADQFAWGVMAYELLAGIPPWGRDIDALELVSKLLSEDPPSLGGVCPDVPSHVATVIARAMAKKRGGRFDTMEQLVAALEDTSGAFAPTMPRISISDPELPRAPPPPAKALAETNKTTVPRRARSMPWMALALGAAGVVAVSGVAFVASRAVREPHVSLPDAASTATTASFPDYGSPMSKVPEATAAYRKGMAAFRDADADEGLAQLDRAIALDPEFAAAQLRRGLWRISLGRKDREHTREAVRLREALGPHDRIFVDALAPLLDVPENLGEAARRLSAAFAQSPNDADFALALCRARQATGEFQDARPQCSRARDLDPGSAATLLEVALVQEHLDDVPGSIASLEACLRASPLASSCFEPLWLIQTYQGRCADALTTARRLVSNHPDSADAYDHLAMSLAGAGEAPESVRLALAQKLPHLPAEEARIAKPHDAMMFDILTGAFVDAEVQLRAWDEAVQGSHSEVDHLPLGGTRVQFAEEQGKTKEAVSLIRAYLKERPAWTLGGEGDFSIFFTGELYALGVMPREDFMSKRTQWLAHDKPRPWHYPWVDAFAIPSRTDADARDALDALPGYLPLPDPMTALAEWEGAIGRTYHLAGRDGEALPFLLQASRSCSGLQSPFEQTWASFDLGATLEGVGQAAAACDAYRIVLRRWGRASTSRTAARARVRIKVLHCAD